MALKMKKDIKKSSYYVWFLGAKESKGLRGAEYVLPIIENLEEREKDVEPFKVTLQVSHKGLKIIQNVVSQTGKNKPKNETIKHFIPHNTITCVHQKDDIIACILLLFNPVTKCPLHVHAYRCDSLETATLLKNQLQMLIERPENQKKISEIENRLSKTKEAKKDSSIGSDTGTSTRESESSEERFGNDVSRVSTLYDSVAAELRAKLNKNDVPILLPPRDYDTVHRQKGNLTGIELRRCLNTNIVGQNVKARRIESSGGSSGIGSDHAPSPESPDVNDTRYHALDGHSTSDEDWNADNDTSLYLMDTVLPPTFYRQNRNEPERVVPEVITKYDYRTEQRNPRQFDQKVSKQHLEDHIRKKLAARQESKKYNYDSMERQNSLEFSEVQSKPPRRYQERERERPDRTRMEYYREEDKIKRENREIDDFTKPSPKTRQRYYQEETKFNEIKNNRNKYYQEETDHCYKIRSKQEESPSRRQFRTPSPNFEEIKISPRDRFKDAKEKFLLLERERYEDEMRSRKETPVKERKYFDENIIRKEEHKKYRDKKEDYKRQSSYDLEQPISPVHKEKPFIKRHESLNYINKDFERYKHESKERQERQNRHEREERQERNHERYEDAPKPAPRSILPEDVRYRREERIDKNDPKRRSMFNLATDDHKRNSLEIAKELKRRSYLEQNYYEKEAYHNDDDDEKAYLSNFSKSNMDLDQLGNGKYSKNQKVKSNNHGGYRNSYAEPPRYRQDKGGKKFEVLHRTNSTVSNNGRVGIASVHPY